MHACIESGATKWLQCTRCVCRMEHKYPEFSFIKPNAWWADQWSFFVVIVGYLDVIRMIRHQSMFDLEFGKETMKSDDEKAKTSECSAWYHSENAIENGNSRFSSRKKSSDAPLLFQSCRYCLLVSQNKFHSKCSHELTSCRNAETDYVIGLSTYLQPVISLIHTRMHLSCSCIDAFSVIARSASIQSALWSYEKFPVSKFR